MAAVSRPPAPPRLAEDRVREAEHLTEVGVSGNHHQIVGRRQQAHITDVSSLGPRLARQSPFTCIQSQAGDSAPPSCPSTHRYSTSENSAESSHGLFGAVPLGHIVIMT
jgi:hypothetical protein